MSPAESLCLFLIFVWLCVSLESFCIGWYQDQTPCCLLITLDPQPRIPASVWVCLQLIALTSGITPSHSAVPTGFTTKEKENPHLTHTTKEKIDFTRMPQKGGKKKTLLYLWLDSSRWTKQSVVVSLFSCSETLVWWTEDIWLLPEVKESEKCGEFTESCYEQSDREKNERRKISGNVQTKQFEKQRVNTWNIAHTHCSCSYAWERNTAVCVG